MVGRGSCLGRLAKVLWCVLGVCSLAGNPSRALAEEAKMREARPAAPASYGRWRSCKIGGGGYIQNVVLCPTNPNRAYAYVDVGGIYRSDDGGRRWRMLHANLPPQPTSHNVRSLVVDPRDDDRVIAAVGDPWVEPLGVFVSQDGGETWRRTLKAPFFGNGEYRWSGLVLARRPDNPDVLLAATIQEGVWRSKDSGETWQECGAKDLYPSDLKFDRADPDRVWLCAQNYEGWLYGEHREWKGGLYRSEDGGLNWSKIAERSPSEILQDPVDAGILYGLFDGVMHRSQDGGGTWTLFRDGLSPRTEGGYASEGEFQSLAAGPDFVLTASTKGTFYRLRSGETAWQRIEREGVEQIYEGEEWFGRALGYFGSALCSIVVDPRDPQHWFFSDWFGIYQTTDAGKHWKLTIDGIEVTVLHTLQQDPTDGRVVHLGMADNGYFYSEDRGERFRHVGWRQGITNNVKCISVSRARPERVYAVGTQASGWESNQVFISDDRGRTWRRSAMKGLPDMTQHHCNSIAVSPTESDYVYLAVSGEVRPDGGGVYASADAGESWTWMGEGLPQGEEFFTHSIWGIGRELAVGGDGSLVCISRDRWQVYRYSPSTRRWRAAEVTLGERPNCVVANPHKRGRFFLAADGVYRSDDWGVTWEKKLRGSVAHVTVDLAKSSRVAAGTDDGVALSEDAGETWQVLDRSLPDRRHDLVAFAGDRLLAGSDGSGCFWTSLSPLTE